MDTDGWCTVLKKRCSANRQCVFRQRLAVYETSYKGVSDNIKRKIARKTTSLARKIRRHHGKQQPRIKTRGLFFAMHLVQRKGVLEADSTYWKEKGWAGRKRPWK